MSNCCSSPVPINLVLSFGFPHRSQCKGLLIILVMPPTPAADYVILFSCCLFISVLYNKLCKSEMSSFRVHACILKQTACMQIKADVESAGKLRQEAQQLPVQDDALIAQLEDASTTYCLCGLPNKVEGSMLKCSQCPKLFHLACLGIPREKEPKKLVCAQCSGKAGHRYAWAVRVSLSDRAILCYLYYVRLYR